MSMSQKIDDISKLVKFIDDLESQLDYFIEYRSKSFLKSSYDDELTLRLLLNAWQSTKPRFITLRDHLQKMESLEKLQSVGLTGSELYLKLYYFNESLDELKTEEIKFKKLESPVKMNYIIRQFRRLKDHWEKCLDFANIILGSLSIAGVPGADAIGEMKDTIEKIIRWWKRA